MTLQELDRLAGEKIMGYKLIMGKWIIDDLGYFNDYWQPTRNIAQAWQCLEKLNSEYRIFSSLTGGHYCDVLPDPKANWICGYGEQASIAIVRACLMAKGIEIE